MYEVGRTGPWTPAIHELLGRLERAGFDGAAHVVTDLDDQDRKMLTYVEAEAGSLRLPPRRCCTSTASGRSAAVPTRFS